jgi:hypothetical protein
LEHVGKMGWENVATSVYPKEQEFVANPMNQNEE